jgi:hypothetical protein
MLQEMDSGDGLDRGNSVKGLEVVALMVGVLVVVSQSGASDDCPWMDREAVDQGGEVRAVTQGLDQGESNKDGDS